MTPESGSREQTTGGFVAGTLVHTKEGLVPIDHLRVGDLVLSQPENNGELSYRPVLNTFVFEDREVYRVTYYIKGGAASEKFAFHNVEGGVDQDIYGKASEEPESPQDAVDNLFHPFWGDSIESLISTGNHPFWVQDVGWTAVDHLSAADELELHNGETAEIWQIEKVFATDQPGVGWSRHGRIEEPGHLIDFRNDSVTIGVEPVYVDEAPFLKVPVFNIEVEGTHTYYVGKIGAWVHNTHCRTQKMPHTGLPI